MDTKLICETCAHRYHMAGGTSGCTSLEIHKRMRLEPNVMPLCSRAVPFCNPSNREQSVDKKLKYEE